jgi:hypothetical protein
MLFFQCYPTFRSFDCNPPAPRPFTSASLVVGFGAMATWITTTPGRAGDGTRLDAAEFGKLLEQSRSVVDQSWQQVWHRAYSLN